jgi:hypothetical protein
MGRCTVYTLKSKQFFDALKKAKKSKRTKNELITAAWLSVKTRTYRLCTSHFSFDRWYYFYPLERAVGKRIMSAKKGYLVFHKIKGPVTTILNKVSREVKKEFTHLSKEEIRDVDLKGWLMFVKKMLLTAQKAKHDLLAVCCD